MKKLAKSIVFVLLFAIVCSTLIVVPAVADTWVDTDDIIYVGEGAAHDSLYSLGLNANTEGIADSLNGKTIKLVSDVNDKAALDAAEKTNTAVWFNFSAGGTVTIDGQGHSLMLTHSIIATSTTGTANLTVQNLSVCCSRANVTAFSARKNSHITLQNCYIGKVNADWGDSYPAYNFQAPFGLSTNGFGIVTVESGYYEGDAAILLGSYDYSAGSVDANKIVINGGFFKVSSDSASLYAPFKLQVKTKGCGVEINGGTFIYQTVDHPFFVTNGSGSTTKATLGTFDLYVPKTFDEDTLFGTQKTADTMTYADTSANITLHKTASNGAGNGASVTKTNPIKPNGITVNNASVADLYFKDGTTMSVSAATLTSIAGDANFQKALNLILLTADTDITADFDYVVLEKNGHAAANLTGDLLRDGLDGAQVFIQYHKTDDTHAAARILVAYSADYTSATFTLQGSKDPAVKNVGKYFTSIQAGGNTVTAAELGGTKILVLDITGLEKDAFHSAPHSLTITLTASDGVNNSTTGAKVVNVQIPDSVYAAF